MASIENLKSAIKRAWLPVFHYSGMESARDSLWAASGRLPAAVLLFHRVTAKIPEDGISITPERFRWMIRGIKEHYRPVSLSTLLDHIEQRKPWPARTVVVTFDDGYLDNYEEAAPILSEFGVPAAFFIASGLIGTDRVLPWEEHLRGRVPWMQWKQVRELHARGFEIGSHTLSHCDLGKVRGEEARREIADSRKKLQDELGAEVRMFAYPFGARDNMLPENVELVREAGYRCCCSAYGGFVTPRSDLFHLQRTGINNWYREQADVDFVIRHAAPWTWLSPED